jgi:hypothetical protein
VREGETEGTRLVRAATCEPALFAEVAADAGATRAALYVVFGVALAAGIGHLPAGGLSGLLAGSARWLLAWVVWLLTVHLGALALGHPSALGRLFRSFGYASVPFALAAFEWIPLLGALIWLAKWGLGFFAFTTGARQALELENSSSALLCAVGVALAALAVHLV